MTDDSGRRQFLDGLDDFLTREIGLSLFHVEDPRCRGGLRLMGAEYLEEQRRRRATFGERLETLPLADLPGWIVDFVTGEFEQAAALVVSTIRSELVSLSEGMSALKHSSAYWLNRATDISAADPARYPPELVNTAKIKLRLRTRVDHWTAEAVRAHRERTTEREAAWDATAVMAPDQGQAPAAEPAASETSEAPALTETHKRVDAYLDEVESLTGARPTRKELWSPKYKRATEFERWQREDARTTHRARVYFEKLLRDRPHLKP